MRKVPLRVGPEYAKKRLDQFIAEKMSLELSEPLSKARARALIVAGAVYLNGKRVRIASKELIPGARIEVWYDAEKSKEAPKRVWKIQPEEVLFRGDGLIVVNKPSGIPTQPTIDEARSNAFRSVKEFLKSESGEADPYVGLHHRLDSDTSGVILFTTDKKANKPIADLFAEHRIQKTYMALVEKKRQGTLASDWTVRNYLGKVSRSGESRFGAVRSGGDPAETRFRCIAQNELYAWVEAQPITGRTHQIRVHLSEDLLPIVGDRFYGGLTQLGGLHTRLMLHAFKLSFSLPGDAAPREIVAPLPRETKAFLELTSLELPREFTVP